MTSVRQRFRVVLLACAWLLSLACFSILSMAIVPVVPWIRVFAFAVVPNHAPWFLVWTLLALVIGMAAHWQRPTGITKGLLVVVAFATLEAGGIVTDLLYVAKQNGARIDLAQTLFFRDFSDDAAPDESFIYSRPDGEPLWLDVYHPASFWRGQDSPLLFAVHGGGFVGGSRRTGAANMRGFTKLGWTVISIDYRLARRNRATWELAGQDVRCALAWTTRNAGHLRIDLSQITLSGASAGGSLALAAGYNPGTGGFDRTCGPRVPPVAAVIAKAPLIDPVGSWDNPGEFRTLQRFYMTQYLGGPPNQFPKRYATVDLRRHIRSGNPRTLILSGADDPILPLATLEDFAHESSNVGNSVRLVSFPYSGHDFNTTFGSITNQTVRQIIFQFMAKQPRSGRGANPEKARQ